MDNTIAWKGQNNFHEFSYQVKRSNRQPVNGQSIMIHMIYTYEEDEDFIVVWVNKSIFKTSSLGNLGFFEIPPKITQGVKTTFGGSVRMGSHFTESLPRLEKFFSDRPLS